MANEILLVANGDLRLSANRMCWPAQQEMEAKLTAAIESAGGSVRRAHEYDATKQHGFIDSQKRGLEVFRLDQPQGATGCRRGGLAVFAAHSGRPHEPSGADPDGGELERPVAWSGRDAQPQWQLDEGGCGLFDAVERGLQRTTSSWAA